MKDFVEKVKIMFRDLNLKDDEYVVMQYKTDVGIENITNMHKQLYETFGDKLITIPEGIEIDKFSKEHLIQIRDTLDNIIGAVQEQEIKEMMDAFADVGRNFVETEPVNEEDIQDDVVIEQAPAAGGR